ncbi:hypothetical protein [Desulfobacula phenolica]|uniref:hypothetical protein n=1 Tax=Desulfobacula phenolica TaxID=90732 RepID=UPI001114295C|nr:hypothetical protein [Desulfobacula phenolica]
MALMHPETGKIIRIEKTIHNRQYRLKLIFEPDNSISFLLNNLNDLKWSRSMGCRDISSGQPGYLKKNGSSLETKIKKR